MHGDVVPCYQCSWCSDGHDFLRPRRHDGSSRNIGDGIERLDEGLSIGFRQGRRGHLGGGISCGDESVGLTRTLQVDERGLIVPKVD